MLSGYRTPAGLWMPRLSGAARRRLLLDDPGGEDPGGEDPGGDIWAELPAVEHVCEFPALDLADSTLIAAAGQLVAWGQGTAGAQMLYRTGTAGIAELGAAVCDGDDWMSLGVGRVGGTGLFAAETEQFTAAVVIANAVPESGSACFLGRRENGSTAVFHPRIDAAGRLFLRARGNENTVAPTGTITPNGTHLIVVTWDGTTGRLYVDGGAALTWAPGTAAEETAEPILLGASTAGGPQTFMPAGAKYGLTFIASAAYEGEYATYRAELESYAMDRWEIGA